MHLELNDKQSAFALEYIKDFNGTHAAIRAGYAEKSAEVQASRLLRNVKVKARIAELKAERAAVTAYDATQVLIRLGEMSDADPKDILNDDGSYKPLSEWPIVWRRMLQSCDIEEEWSEDGTKTGRVVKIKFIDRLKTLELIGKHVDVRAYAPDVHNHLHLTVESVEMRLSAGRDRLRQLAVLRATL